MKVPELYDTITFEPCSCDGFTIDGCGDISTEQNTIYRGYLALLEHTNSIDLEEFFKSHKVVVEKNIPSQAGLGGGSSDVAAFMRLAITACWLDIDTETLARIGSSIGADVPFFIYDYSSANVKGFGEIVEPFDEPSIPLEIMTPESIGCDTSEVYKTFKKFLLQYIDSTSHFGWENLDSRTLLNLIADPIALNDLYPAAMVACPKLEELDTNGWFFSGSGSSFFRPM